MTKKKKVSSRADAEAAIDKSKRSGKWEEAKPSSVKNAYTKVMV